jgi:ATP-dependent protease HslVU (ClpYQ) peptidase subunit
MTCIVGIVEGGAIYLGGDSAGVAGWDIVTRADAKVFCNGPMIMGFTSSFRMGQLLRYTFTPPSHADDLSTSAYMCTVFINAIRDCLKAGGYAKKDSERESGGTFLVGYRGQLFQIADDYQVGEVAYPYNAVGCGAHIALGALHATASLEMKPKKRLTAALKAAEEFSNGVRGPFHIECLPEKSH